MPAELAPIPRVPFAVACGVGAVASVLTGLATASGAGGGQDVLIGVGIALGLLAAMSIVPLIGPPLISAESWGLAVLGVSGLRTIGALGAMLVLIEVQGLARKPAVYGLLIGTVVMLIAEAGAAVWLLSRRERLRTVRAGKTENAFNPTGDVPGSVNG